MFLVSIVLSISLTTQFANSIFQPINGGKPRFVPQQEPSTAQVIQDYSPNMPQLSMEGNQQIYPMLQQSMMQQPMMQQPMIQQPMMQQPMMQQLMMQGFHTPSSLNPITQQQLSLLLMSSYARLMALTQLLNMHDKNQLYQPNQYSDPAVNNYGPTPAQLPYAQQPQEDLQNNLQNEMLQQHQQAESEQQEILRQQRIKRENDIETQRHNGILKRKEEEDKFIKQQEQFERQVHNVEEINREKKEYEKQILEEEENEQAQKKKDLKLSQQLKFKQNLRRQMKQIPRNMKLKPKADNIKHKSTNFNKKLEKDNIKPYKNTMKKIH